MEEPVDLVPQRFEIDRLVGEVGSLKNREDPGKGGGAGFTHIADLLNEKPPAGQARNLAGSR